MDVFGKAMRVALLSAVMVAGATAPAAALHQPTLVGVIVHPEDAAESSAIIDGRRVRVGELYQGMRLTEVHPDHVKLVDESSGQAFALGFATASAVDDLTESIPSPERMPSAGRGPQAGSPTLAVPAAAQAVADEGWLDTLNPMKLVWVAYTVMAQASLRQIHTAQQMYAVQDLDRDGHDHFSGDLAELGRHRLVQDDLAGGEKFGYRFFLRRWEDDAGPHFECFADPLSDAGQQPHLYLDESGVVRGQVGGRAGVNSPPYETSLF